MESSLGRSGCSSYAVRGQANVGSMAPTGLSGSILTTPQIHRNSDKDFRSGCLSLSLVTEAGEKQAPESELISLLESGPMESSKKKTHPEQVQLKTGSCAFTRRHEQTANESRFSVSTQRREDNYEGRMLTVTGESRGNISVFAVCL